MPKYELRVALQLVNVDDDEVAASSDRSYAVDDDIRQDIGQAIAHAGQSFTLFVEGIQKLGLRAED